MPCGIPLTVIQKTMHGRDGLSALPAEMLSSVFNFAVNTRKWTKASKVDTETLTLMSIASVSREWRETALSNCQLWASNINPEMKSTVFDLILSRSRECNISVISGIPGVHLRGNDREVITNYTKLLGLLDRCEHVSLILHPSQDGTIENLQLKIAYELTIIPRKHLYSLEVRRSDLDIDVEDVSSLAPVSTPFQFAVKSSLRKLSLQGAIARDPSLSIHRPISDLTSLILQGHSFQRMGRAERAPTDYFTPSAIGRFIQSMSTLETLVLDTVLEWVELSLYDAPEGSFREAVERELGLGEVGDIKIALPHLRNFLIRGDAFGCGRFMDRLQLPKECKSTVRVNAGPLARYDPDPIRNMLQGLLAPLSHPVRADTWTFGLQPDLSVRTEVSGEVHHDLHVEIGYLGRVDVEEVWALYSSQICPSMDQWLLGEATCLRLVLGRDQEGGYYAGELKDLQELLFQRCTGVKELHVHGLSLATFDAIAGSSFCPGNYNLLHHLPSLTHLFVFGSCFTTSKIFRNPVEGNYQYLENMISHRLEKGTRVTQVEELVIINDILRPEPNLMRRIGPFLSRDSSVQRTYMDEDYYSAIPPLRSIMTKVSVRLVSLSLYRKSDPGIKDNCEFCSLFGSWDDVYAHTKSMYMAENDCSCLMDC